MIKTNENLNKKKYNNNYSNMDTFIKQSINKKNNVTKKIYSKYNNINVSYKYSNKNNLIKKIFQLKYKKLILYLKNKLYVYKKNKDFIKKLNLIFLIFNFKSTNILLNYILINIKYSRKQKQIQFINNLIQYLSVIFSLYKKKIIGLKIQIKGRINSSLRSKKRILQLGKTPLSTYKIKVKYSFGHVIHKDGAFGVKVWFFYKK